MGSIQNIVNVQISRQTSVPTRAGFGTGAFISEDATALATATKSYSTLAAVLADGSNGADSKVFAAAYFGQQQAPTKLTIIKAPGDGSLTDVLTAGIAHNNDWYGLAIASRVKADIEEVSALVQGYGFSNPKLFFPQTSDAAVITAADTDVASVLQGLSSFRSSIWYHGTNAEFLDGAMLGGQLPNDPGSITWAYKQAAGVTPGTITDAEKAFAHGKACNTYTTIAGVNVTEEGKCSDAPFEWIDVIRGIDWIQVNLTADLFTLLVNLPKLTYDTAGLALIESTIERRLRRAQLMGILSRDSAPVVTVPSIADIPSEDYGSRTLNGVTFSAVVGGAVQKINLQGTVTL